MDLKFLVDTLSSVAAIVAISAAMIGWYRSVRKPLLVDRVVIHLKTQNATFVLMVKNVKPHPVTISRIGCYTRKKHQVQRKGGGKPEYSEMFSSSDGIFDSKGDFEILPNGFTDVRVEVAEIPDLPKTLLFLLHTSHGFHELWCTDIQLVEIGKGESYRLDYQYESGSALRAKAMYYWKRLLSLLGK